MRNSYRVDGDVVYIQLKSEKYGEMETKISLCDLEEVSKMPFTWYPKINEESQQYYVAANIYISEKKRTTIRLHRYILSPENYYLEVDHINHDTLDNTRENLRITTKSQNQMNRNRSNRNNKTKALGVSYRKDSGKYRVRLYKNRKLVFNSEFDSLEVATQVSIDMRTEIYGEYFNSEVQ